MPLFNTYLLAIYKSMSGCFKPLMPFFIGAALLIAGCQTDMEQIQRITSRTDLPDMYARTVEIIYTTSGTIQVKAIAPEVKSYTSESVEEPYSLFPAGLQVWFYDKNAQLISHLTTDYAKYYQSEQLWEARYDIEIVNAEGDVLTTEHLYASEKEEQIYTDKYVQIVNADGSKVSGEGGFESNFNFTSYKFHQVEGLIHFENDN